MQAFYLKSLKGTRGREEEMDEADRDRENGTTAQTNLRELLSCHDCAKSAVLPLLLPVQTPPWCCQFCPFLFADKCRRSMQDSGERCDRMPQ